MALSKVPGDEELYIGGIFTLRRKSLLAETGITHIVSVLKYDFKDFEDWDKYEHLQIEVDDSEDEDLLGEFERTGAWIEHALREWKDENQVKKGKVLVHCAMGKSRSVTIVLAYMLRQNPTLTVSEALELVRKSRPMAEPNEGFMAQLELYKQMVCPKDIDAHPKYQRWLYQREVQLALAAGMAPEKLRFEDEHAQDPADGPERDVQLRCKKCRRTVATSQYLVPHTADTSYTPTKPVKDPLHQPLPGSDLPACTHHFIQPLSWMRTELEQGLLSGRLECPNAKCGAQLGRYAWQGMRCSCGKWICPAFSLQKGRVDEVIKDARAGGIQNLDNEVGATARAIGAIRLPPGMRRTGSL
ncbi:protein-tyrosine phosphatase-like protein [Xylogone sp. PMI_703]|nr:protein-tyrosine phosphatase-like protein [Xylogone sp. PMI_703]